MTERIGQLQAVAAAAGFDAAVLRLPENVLLATEYFVTMAGLGLVVIPADGPATLLVPEFEEEDARRSWGGDVRTFPAIRNDGPSPGAAIASLLRDLARELGVAGGRIGFEGSFESVAPPYMAGETTAIAAPTQVLISEAFATKRLVDISETLESLRTVKTDAELDRIRTANEIAAIGLRAFREHAVPGRSEVEIVAAVESAIYAGGHGHRGARAVRACATVNAGPALVGGWQYFRARTRPVERDELVLIELGTMADGYWADHTRTVVAGRASSEQRQAFEAVRAAGEAALACAVPGAVGGAVDAAARAACQEGGFRQFPHHTGHGLGFRWHESRPLLGPGSDDELAAGMVLAIEPGIYEAAIQGGVRHEDNAVVAPAAATLLAPADVPFELE